jgi:hypothetical protein
VLIRADWASNGHRCPEADSRNGETWGDEHLDGGMKKRSGSWSWKHTRNQRRQGQEGVREQYPFCLGVTLSLARGLPARARAWKLQAHGRAFRSCHVPEELVIPTGTFLPG